MIRGSKYLIRNMNKVLIIDTLLIKQPLSRPKLVEITNLSQTTVHEICKELLKKRVIKEDTSSPSEGGRKPRMLTINDKWGFAIGIKIDREGFYSGLVDLGGRVHFKTTYPLPQLKKEESIMETLNGCVNELISKGAEYGKREILGIGIGITGRVSFKEGILMDSPLLGWPSIRLKELLEQETGLPVCVDNDVNVLISAEILYGERKRGANNILCVLIGSGIGGGILLNNNVYRGSYGGAGEFGHMVIDEDGPQCRCGRQGCLTTLASDEFLINEAKKSIFQEKKTKICNLMMGEGLKEPSAEIVLRATFLGDEVASAIYEESVRNLVLGLDNLISIFEPEIIIVGRERLATEPGLLKKIAEFRQKNKLPFLPGIKIVPFSLKKDGWIIGAADLVFQKAMRSPIEIE